MKLVVATRNRHKLEELRALLGGLPVELVPIDEVAPGTELPETGDTFEANAIQKARAAADATGLPAIADDSGLEVDALGGAPGVWSARFAGEPSDDARNNARLVEKLRDLPPAARTARYRAVIAVVPPGGGPARLAAGACEGTISLEPRGRGGFGYDPHFVLPDGRHMAELPPDEKNRISHRAGAAAALRTELAALASGAAWPGVW